MPRKRIRWTPAMLQTLRWHAAAGHTMAAAAADLGVSRGSVGTMASNKDIAFRGNCARELEPAPARSLAAEIAAARAEAPSAPPYRDPHGWPR